MKVLITGSAGFIGFSLALSLLEAGIDVVGLDNHNSYYDPKLKEDRLKLLLPYDTYSHHRIDICDRNLLAQLFNLESPTHIVHLAAQAGVRYSIENPYTYISSNIDGFLNILECARHHNIQHFVYASSSSVYGANSSMPFSVQDPVNHPLSLYAATKKSNELIAHSYSHLYNLPCTGLRFFTVYGPWGRPDMALFKFTKAIIAGEPINVFNYGNHRRDFTYIDDIVNALTRLIPAPPCSDPTWSSVDPNPSTSSAPWTIFNIGSNNPVNLLDYIKEIERSLNLTATLNLLPLQAGDVPDTYANVDELVEKISYQPSTSIRDGVSRFINWYTTYYQ